MKLIQLELIEEEISLINVELDLLTLTNEALTSNFQYHASLLFGA